MQNSFGKTITFICALFLFTSCLKQTESITPLAPVQTLAQLQREALMTTALTAANGEFSDTAQTTITESRENPDVFFLNIRYNIKELDVFESADIPNSFEKIGHSFLRGFIKLFLRIKGSQKINLDPIAFELPDMNLDFEVVKSIKVKRIFLEYNKEFDDSVNNAANFSFVSNLDFYKVDGKKPLLFTYKKAQNNCKYKCLDFTILDGDIFDLIRMNSESITLKPALTINSLPRVSELILDGQIELQIGLKLPF